MTKSILAMLLAAGLSIPFNNQVVIDSRVLSAVFFFFSGTTIYLVSKRISIRSQLIFGSISLLIYVALAQNLFGDSKVSKFLSGHEYSIVFLFGTAIFLLLLTSYSLPNSKILNNRLVQGFGNLSYSIYLWHVPVQVFIMLVCAQYGVDITRLANSYIFFLIYLTVLTLIARFSFKLIEDPLRMRLRAKS
jgi:peptidoglycan/LPS O-acetylase OafA/YrhL